MARSFRDLIAWQRALDLAANVYDKTKTWPREFLHHLSIADGSLAEVEAHLLLAQRVGFIEDVTLDGLVGQIEETRRLIRGLIRSLR